MNLNEVPVILSIDPEFRDLIPPLTQEEQQGLLESILEEGCRDPIIVHNNTIIDGHNRYEICREMHIPFKTAPFPGKADPTRDDLKVWIIDNQLSRRNISTFDRVSLELLKEPIIAARAKENQGTRTDLGNNLPQKSAESQSDRETRTQIAHLAGVSHDTVAKVKKIPGAQEMINRCADPRAPSPHLISFPIHNLLRVVRYCYANPRHADQYP